MGVLSGSYAVVTGGSRGIGAAIVRRLAADGAAVVFSYRTDAAAARSIVDEIGAEHGAPRAHAVRADIGSVAEIRELFAEAGRWAADVAPEGLSVVVNNAGSARTVPIAELTEDYVDRAFAENTKGPLFVLQQAGALLRDGGRVINISTVNTSRPAPGVAVHAGSKSAMERITAVAALEFGARGITVNSVAPGATDTDLFFQSNHAVEEATLRERVAAYTALGRMGTAPDIARVVGFLAGPDGGWVTGQTIVASGGFPP